MEMIYIVLFNMFVCLLVFLFTYKITKDKEKDSDDIIKEFKAALQKSYNEAIEELEKNSDDSIKEFKTEIQKFYNEAIEELEKKILEDKVTLKGEKVITRGSKPVKKEPELLSSDNIEKVEVYVTQVFGDNYSPKYGINFRAKKVVVSKSYDTRFNKNNDIGLGENVLARDSFRFDPAIETLTSIIKEFCDKYKDSKDIFDKIAWATIDFGRVLDGMSSAELQVLFKEYFNFDKNLYGETV